MRISWKALRTAAAVVLTTVLAAAMAVSLAGCAKPRPPKDAYFGTWINERGLFKKTVYSAAGFADYYYPGDPSPAVTGPVEVVDSWLDSEGNAWFKTHTTMVTGREGKVQSLIKVHHDGKSLELQWNGVLEWNPKAFPTRFDPGDERYWPYQRQGE